MQRQMILMILMILCSAVKMVLKLGRDVGHSSGKPQRAALSLGLTGMTIGTLLMVRVKKTCEGCEMTYGV